jgi:hypothetical protein
MESALKGNGWIICYPIYLDAKKTIAEGRRVPKEKAVENPTFDEVQMCLQALKLEHVGFVSIWVSYILLWNLFKIIKLLLFWISCVDVTFMRSFVSKDDDHQYLYIYYVYAYSQHCIIIVARQGLSARLFATRNVQNSRARCERCQAVHAYVTALECPRTSIDDTNDVHMTRITGQTLWLKLAEMIPSLETRNNTNTTAAKKKKKN